MKMCFDSVIFQNHLISLCLHFSSKVSLYLSIDILQSSQQYFGNVAGAVGRPHTLQKLLYSQEQLVSAFPCHRNSFLIQPGQCLRPEGDTNTKDTHNLGSPSVLQLYLVHVSEVCQLSSEKTNI